MDRPSDIDSGQVFAGSQAFCQSVNDYCEVYRQDLLPRFLPNMALSDDSCVRLFEFLCLFAADDGFDLRIRKLGSHNFRPVSTMPHLGLNRQKPTHEIHVRLQQPVSELKHLAGTGSRFLQSLEFLVANEFVSNLAEAPSVVAP